MTAQMDRETLRGKNKLLGGKKGLGREEGGEKKNIELLFSMVHSLQSLGNQAVWLQTARNILSFNVNNVEL